jgi:LacI family transcriptional regulator, repressor for deo operon, udp, cdd, tsx, nupC, and nupG
LESRPSTIEDVAAHVGVSVATVSRALHNLPNVAPATRERVRRAAEELEYHPNPSAAAMRAGRTNTVALVVPMLDSWYFSQVMAGAEAVLSEAGYDLLLFKVDSDDSRKRLLSGPLVKRADGLILVDISLPEDERVRLLKATLKVVSVGIDIEGASSVMVDDCRIAKEAVAHLVELGHRDIAIIGGEVFVETARADTPKQRRLGYEAALAESGIERRPEFEVFGNFSVEGGDEAMTTLLNLPKRPTAVFAISDEMAFGALRQLFSRAMRAPRDMSIVGVDDHEFAEVVGLTTFRQEVADHGASAARLLLERLSDSSLGPVIHQAKTEFIERSSTARLSARASRRSTSRGT